MDPNANLQQQLSAAREVIAAIEKPPWVAAGATSDEWGDEQDRADYFEGVGEQGRGLAELVLALDEWRRNGGFDPYAVQPKVWVLMITTKHGTDVGVYATADAASVAITEYVREWWDEDGPGADGESAPEDAEEMVEAYFESRFDDNYDITEELVA